MRRSYDGCLSRERDRREREKERERENEEITFRKRDIFFRYLMFRQKIRYVFLGLRGIKSMRAACIVLVLNVPRKSR
jgi:hypothetical protein